MASKSNKNKTSNTKAHGKKKQAVTKQHGTLLTIVLVLMGLHGIVAAYAYYALNTAPEVQRPWIITMMVVHFLLNIVAAVAIFYWKKWGIYIYVASTIIAVVAGMLAVGIWSLWYMLMPLIILGWILRTKWNYFE
jgi:hypothetical protein